MPTLFTPGPPQKEEDVDPREERNRGPMRGFGDEIEKWWLANRDAVLSKHEGHRTCFA